MLTVVSGMIGVLVIGIWLALQSLLKDKPYSNYVKKAHKVGDSK